jgi:hypothetical protein
MAGLKVIPKAPSPGLDSAITYYTLGAIFVIPLLIGVFVVGTNADRTNQANQVSHDLASMYAQGVDFSNVANQKIAMRVADGVGMKLEGGQAVVILSKLRVVRESDCGSSVSPKCANHGYPVVTQRYVIGNAALRGSSLGSPARVDSKTGDVLNWATDTSARADVFSMGIKDADYTYAAECYLASPDALSGVYSRAMF